MKILNTKIHVCSTSNCSYGNSELKNKIMYIVIVVTKILNKELIYEAPRQCIYLNTFFSLTNQGENVVK